MNTHKRSIASLREEFADIQTQIGVLKERAADIQRELLDRTKEHFVALMTAREKIHGDVTDTVFGERLKYSVKQTVKWDSARLAEVRKSIPAEAAEKIFKVELSIPEAKYAALSDVFGDSEIVNKIKEARTVKYSEPKVEFAD